jgi:hypothetical protein
MLSFPFGLLGYHLQSPCHFLTFKILSHRVQQVPNYFFGNILEILYCMIGWLIAHKVLVSFLFRHLPEFFEG